MTIEDLGKKTKEKYPEYSKYSDLEVGKKILEKYPEYQSKLSNYSKPEPKKVEPKKGFFSEAFEDIKQTGGALKSTFGKTTGKMQESLNASIKGEQSPLAGTLQGIGYGFGGISQGIGDIFTGAVKTVMPQSVEEDTKKILSAVATPVVQSESVKNVISKYESLTPEKKRNVDALFGVGSFLLDVVGLGVGKKAGTKALQVGSDVAETTAKQVAKTTGKVSQILPKSQALKEGTSGLFQTGKEISERVPRAVEGLKESLEKAKVRAYRIQTSSPSVANAIKVNLPETFIEGVSQADQPTIKAMKRTLDIAERKPAGFNLKVQPSSVSGELAVKQFEIIDKQRAIIGKQIGNAVDELSKTMSVPMQPAYNKLDEILAQLDITPVSTKTGVKLDFTKSSFSNAQKTKIQELYDLAREGGESLTPAQIYKKDQLFSQLSREARMDKIGDVLVKLPNTDKPQSLFSVFKDVYSKTLDEISPQDIRTLNSEYRKYRTMVDAIEDTLLRGSKNIDDVSLIKKNPAEFAKVNLRRIFGEAGSSAEFAAVAKEMDALARALGYTDASPATLANFANELRKLYPATIPTTGFQGGIRTGLVDVIDTTLKIGKPGLKDQQKALRKLLDNYDKSATMMTPKTNAPIAAQIPQNNAIKSSANTTKQPIVLNNELNIRGLSSKEGSSVGQVGTKSYQSSSSKLPSYKSETVSPKEFNLIQEAKGKTLKEFLKGQQPTKVTFKSALQKKDYMGGHEAPMAEDINAPIWDLTGKFTGNKLYPEDIYSYEASRLYSSGVDYDNQAMSILQSVKNRPNAKVTIYRAVSKDVKSEINAGDWVTLTKEYAKEHGESNLGGIYKIVKKEVNARDIFTDANSIQEFGYDPQIRLSPKDTPYELLSKAYKEGKKDLHSAYQSRLTAIWKEANK